MNARSSFWIYGLTSLFWAGSLLRAQPPEDPLIGIHRAAVELAQAAHAEKLTVLAERYVEFVDRLRATAQNEGELDLTLALLAEIKFVRTNKHLPRREAPTGTAQGRVYFEQQAYGLKTELDAEIRRIDAHYVQALDQRIQELTRAANIPAAMALAEEKKNVEERLAALTPSETTVPAAPATSKRRLGPPLLPGGSFDDDKAPWTLMVPPGGARNRTEIFSEPNSNRNKALRIHQHETDAIHVSQPIKIESDKPYQITWRARLVRAWRPGIETRGKGRYALGFEIPLSVFASFPLADQEKINRAVQVSAEPPPDLEWHTYTRILKAEPQMTHFAIFASKGEGEYLIDDIDVREILQDPAP